MAMNYQESNKCRAVFLDRDGTVNEEVGYLSQPENIRILPDVPNAIRLLKEAGYKVLVITNQSGVARGYYTEDDVQLINKKINEQLMQSGASIDGFFYCPHHPDGIIAKYSYTCKCRKPESGMILEAADKFSLDLTKSFIIGDKLSDLQMAESLGARAVLVLTGYGEREKEKYRNNSSFVIHYIAKDLLNAAHWIVKQT
jgi:D-glycero-D-manno-heptose 1,7-bisphosphate phosphatase